MRLKGVVFDFNGTLLWDTRLHNHAWDLFLERYQMTMTDEEKNLRIHGKNNDLIFQDIFQRKMTAEEIDRFIEEKESIYRELCIAEKIDFAPGSVSFLQFLKANGIAYAIATASEINNVKFYLNTLKLDKLIDPEFILFNDGTYKSKPDPDMFLSAIHRLDLSPAECVIFEDSRAGIKAALAARPGKVIIVNSTGREYPEFDLEIIRSFNEVNREIFET